ncbi:MAG: hypothetical protein ABI305_10990 [Tepidiformaceae bacterium]
MDVSVEEIALFEEAGIPDAYALVAFAASLPPVGGEVPVRGALV